MSIVKISRSQLGFSRFELFRLKWSSEFGTTRRSGKQRRSLVDDDHPLSHSSSSFHQVEVKDDMPHDFIDPLRVDDAYPAIRGVGSNGAMGYKSHSMSPAKEWESFKRLLRQKFPEIKMVPISQASDTILRKQKSLEKSAAATSNELDDPLTIVNDVGKVIAQHEYIAHLQKLKDDISRAWHNDDHFTSLKLCTKEKEFGTFIW